MENYYERGGAWVPYTSETLQVGMAVTWPFAVIRIDQNSVTVQINLRSNFAKIAFPVYIMGMFIGHHHEFKIPYENIVSIEQKKWIPFFADGVKITTKEYQVYYWSLKSSDRIVEEIEKRMLTKRNGY